MAVMQSIQKMDEALHHERTRIDTLTETVTVLRTQIGLFGIIIPIIVTVAFGVIKDALMPKPVPPAAGSRQ